MPKECKNDVTAHEIGLLMSYDAESGVFLWRQTRSRLARAGGEVGTVRPDGYRSVKIRKREYKLHRLAWLLGTGAWPEAEIDHINGDRADNRLSNLRPATRAENARNVVRRNATGLAGVNYRKDTGKYLANIRAGGKKRFIGSYKTAEEAHAAYLSAASLVHGEFSAGNRLSAAGDANEAE